MTSIIAAVALVFSSATADLQETTEPLTVAIDVNIEGNSDSAIGTIDTCAEVAQVGDSFSFDLVVKNVPEASLIAGYQFDIDYDPSVINITDVIDVDAAGSEEPNNVSIISRIDSSEGFSFLGLSEGDLPDDDGSFTVAAIDGTNVPLPPENHESGEGVLARVTAVAVGTGTSDLLIPGPLGGFDGVTDQIISQGQPDAGTPLDVRLAISGRVSVGEPCIAPPTPTVDDVDGPGESPSPGSETTAPGGTTTATSTPSPAGPDDGGDTDDDGSDTLVVIGVIAGIWVVAGVISAAWYVLRRRSRGSDRTE